MKQANKTEKRKRIKKGREAHRIAQQLIKRKEKMKYDKGKGQEDKEDAQLWERETKLLETKNLSTVNHKSRIVLNSEVKHRKVRVSPSPKEAQDTVKRWDRALEHN